jgi:hypothetical protein
MFRIDDLARSPKNDELPSQIPLQERVRRLPEAILLTTGYYASRVPAVHELLKRLD